MTDNGQRNGARPAGGPFYSPQRCPPGTPCLSLGADLAIRPVADRVPYDPAVLSNAEAAELERAVAAAGQELSQARSATEDAATALLAQDATTTRVLEKLAAFAASGRLAAGSSAVARVAARHAHDGPADRRHRPAWVRWALAPTVLAAAAYDTAFFAAVFLRLIDARQSLTSVAFYISLLPGAMLTVALLAAGHWLAEASFRSRAHAERRRERRRLLPAVLAWLRRRPAPVDQRGPDDLPWPRWLLPLGFATLVLATLGLWAVNRANDALGGSGVKTPAAAVALLLLMFSVTAVAVKVIHYNPFADSARAADRQFAAACGTHEKLVAAGAAAVGEYAAVSHRLRGLLDELDTRVKRHLDLAWAAILEQRDRHGLAGTVAPRFGRHDGGPVGTRPTFADIDEPRLPTGVIDAARAVLHDCDVDLARKRYRALAAELLGQLDPVPPAREAPDPAAPGSLVPHVGPR